MYFKITNGAIEIDGKTILEEINFEIKDHEKIALIGRNGSGKTTLFKAIVDNSLLSEGLGNTKFSVIKTGIKKIGYLEQFNFSNSNKTLEEEILGSYSDLLAKELNIAKLEEALEMGADTKTVCTYDKLLNEFKENGGYTYKKEYKQALKKFGFSETDLGKSISSFSGGEQSKIAFLQMLLSKPDLLLLDEATNHLDIEATMWLEDYLKNYKGAVVIISHDRMFINNIVSKIYEISFGSLEEYYGNYEFYAKTKQKNYEVSLKNYELQQKEIKRLQAIADRFRSKPTKASMAMSKLKQIERMVKLKLPDKPNTKTFNIINLPFKESNNLVLDVNNLVIGYTIPLATVNFTLYKKERLGIVGNNGTGKSTLLKTIMNLIERVEGIFKIGGKVSIAYFDQNLNTLNPDNTILEEFIHTFPSLTNYEIHSLLASFMFYEDDINKEIKYLSGGEKVRLELCKVIYQNTNLLILDEPTNHLDIMSKIKLEELLKKYQGTILFVSHDRYFLKSIATCILEFKNNKSTYYNLNYEEYLEKIKNDSSENIIKEERVKKVKPLIKKNSLEKTITKKEEQIKALKDSLYDPLVYNDYKKVNDINKEIEKLNNELNDLMLELLS